MAGASPPAGGNPPARRWLVVNGDDFGLTVGVNAGIERAHRGGILSSASVMPVGPALRDAVARAGRCPDLGIGLHLTLVGERPACRPEEVPSLLGRDGNLLPDYRSFLARYLRSGIRAAELRRELRAQAAAVAALGLAMDHLDSHQHLHLLPGLLAPVLEVAREHGVRWVRAPRPLRRPHRQKTGKGLPIPHPSSDPRRPGVERLAFRVASGWARVRLARAGWPLLEGSLGFDCSGRLTSEYLLRHIPSLPEGVTELICHPGEDDLETRVRYRTWGYHWMQEMEALADPRVREALERAGVRRATFAAIDRRETVTSSAPATRPGPRRAR